MHLKVGSVYIGATLCHKGNKMKNCFYTSVGHTTLWCLELHNITWSLAMIMWLLVTLLLPYFQFHLSDVFFDTSLLCLVPYWILHPHYTHLQYTYLVQRIWVLHHWV